MDSDDKNLGISAAPVSESIATRPALRFDPIVLAMARDEKTRMPFSSTEQWINSSPTLITPVWVSLGSSMFLSPQRASAACLAIALRSSGDRIAALARPPLDCSFLVGMLASYRTFYAWSTLF